MPRKQFVLLVALVAFVISLATSAGILFLFGGGFEFLNNRFLPVPLQQSISQINEKIQRQDELVVSVVKRASPAVVSIVASKDVPVVEQYFVNPFGNDPFFQQFFKDFPAPQVPQYRQKGTTKQQVSAGTGFIVSTDGMIVTNKHVVADTGADYTVFLNDGSKYPAKVLARDPVDDLAIVKIEKSGLPILTLGNSSAIDVGQTVIAIGNALGEFSNTVSVGIVSGLKRSITASGGDIGSENLTDLIQTDAAINPGNSGGPLLNLRGEVIGMNTAMASGAENIGFAIGINKAKRDIASVEKSGKITHPFLGVRYVMISSELAKEKKLASERGALVLGDEKNPAVVKQSPADKAGIKSGDIILAVNGEAIDADHLLSDLIGKYAVGEEITVRVNRNGSEMDVKITLEERK
ncbi:trypsin-like peptidase domain-containing protein [Patescibacteria group bacterium]|nr:trypsin-like peptidase domain-containing protein [Patescibacteria group bacterium]